MVKTPKVSYQRLKTIIRRTKNYLTKGDGPKADGFYRRRIKLLTKKLKEIESKRKVT